MTMKALFGNPTEITLTGLNSLADGASASTVELVENNIDGYMEAEIEITLAGSVAGPCYIYFIRSMDGVFQEDNSNQELIGVIYLDGSNTMRKIFRVPSLPPFWGLRVQNMSGGALASSGNSVYYTGVRYTA